MIVFLCQNGFDGILSGVYDIYASRIPLEECRLEFADEYETRLFAEYRQVPTNAGNAEKVARKIREFMSEEAYIHLYRASLHKSPERADRILRFIALGLKKGRKIVNMLQEPEVFEIFQMNRYVGREAHALIEFARFERLANGVYYCKIGPENQVLELVADHFTDRFPDMNWVIYDEIHRTAAIHSENRKWLIHKDISDIEINYLVNRRDTDSYVGLWKIFFEIIAIEERKNEKCQKNMLPLRYRKYMTEFQ